MPNVDNGALSFDSYIENSDFKRSIDAMRRDIASLSDKTVKETKKMDSAFKKLSVAVAGFFTVQQGTQFVNQLISVRSQFQQLDVAFSTILKSKEKADKLMAQTKALALETPFNLLDIAQANKQLLAYGFNASEVTDTLRMLGNIAAGVSAPLGDISYLYGTLKTQGRAYAMDIRQFTNRGIPIIKELAKQFGVTADKVMELVSAGKVGFPEVEKAFKSLTGAGGIFFNLMEKQSKTLQGQISNLQDKFDFMLNDLGQRSEGFIGGAIDVAADLIGHYEEILKVLGFIITAYGSYRAALLALIVVERTQAKVAALSLATQKELTVAQGIGILTISKLRKAWIALTAVIKANPIGLAVAAITGLVAAYEYFKPEVKSASEAMDDLTKATKNYTNAVKDLDSLLTTYSKLSKNTNRSADENKELQKTINAIASIVPEAATGVDRFGNILAINTDKVKGFRDALKGASEEALKFTIKESEASLAELKKQQQYYNDIINSRQTRVGLFGTNIFAHERGAKPKEVADAVKNIEDVNSKIKQLQGTISEAKKSLNGTFTIYKPEQAKTLETVSQRIEKINEEIKKQQDILGKQRAPGSTVKPDDIKSTLDKIKKLQEERKVLTGENEKSNKKDNENLEKFSNKKKDILEKLSGIQSDYLNQSKDQNQAEIDNAKHKFDELRKRAEEFNKEAPSGQKLGAGFFTALDQAEKNTLGELKYDQETERLKENINKQKQIYAEFYSWRQAFGEKTAREQFKGQIKEADNYTDYLKQHIAALEIKGVGGFTPAMQKRLKMLTDALNEAQKEQNNNQRELLKQSLSETESYEQKILRIKREYAEKAKAIQSSGLGKDETDKRLNELGDNMQKQINEVTQQVLSDNGLKGLGDAIIGVTKQQLLDEITYLKNYLKTTENLTDAQKQVIQSTINDLSRASLTATDSVGGSSLREINIQIGQQKDQILLLQKAKEKLSSTPLLSEANATELAKINAQLEAAKVNLERLSAFRAFSGIAEVLSIADQALNQLSQSVDGLDNSFSEAVRNMSALTSGLLQGVKSVMNVMQDIGDPLSLVSDGINGVISLVGTLVSASAKRHLAEQQFNNDLIKQQDEYNLALNKAILLNQSLKDNVFITDYQGKITDGVKALSDASDHYQEALKKLSDAQVKIGQRNAIDWGNVGKAAAGGAAAGAAIGSIVPVIGTAIGAAVGGIVSGIAGLFGGKKKKDVFGNLLEEYPELIDKSKKGVEQFNNALAQSLIDNKLVTDQSKETLENLIEWKKAVQDAKTQIKDVVGTLAGDLGNNLRNSLVQAFEDGTDAGKAFADSVGQSLENVLSQLIFNQVFGKAFDTLQKQMESSFSPTGDQNWQDDLETFFGKYKGLSEQFDKELEAAKKEAGAAGLDIFQKEEKDQEQGGLSNAIRQSITEDTATELSGRINGMYLIEKENNSILTSMNTFNKNWFQKQMQALNNQIAYMTKIEANTKRTADNSEFLPYLKSIDGKLSNPEDQKRAGGVIR